MQEIACQERTHYTTFAACLKPLLVEQVAILMLMTLMTFMALMTLMTLMLLVEQVAMLREVEQLDGVMDKLNQIIADPFNKLTSSDEILSFVKVRLVFI